MRQSASRGWSLAISVKSIPRGVIELIVVLKSSIFPPSTGLSTGCIGVRCTLSSGVVTSEQWKMQLMPLVQSMLPAFMQLMVEMKMCLLLSSPFGRERASATTFAFPRK